MPIPPPPPPPAALQTIIPPPTNKGLLASIEKGTRLKKVPESAKLDRSAAIVATATSSSENNNSGVRMSQNNGGPTMSKQNSNSPACDFQSQLRNQLLSMQTGSNGVQDQKNNQTVTYPSVRPAVNQPLKKGLSTNNNSSVCSKPQTPPLNKSLSSTHFTTSNNDSYTQPNQSIHGIIRAPPSPGFSNKPHVTLATQPPLFTNKYVPMVSNAGSTRPQSRQTLGYNNQPSQNVSQSTNNTPMFSSQDLSNKIRAPIPNQVLLSNTRGPNQSTNTKGPAPNQPQSISTRAPPPPPSMTKPLQRNSVSMKPKAPYLHIASDPIRPMSSAMNSSELVIRQRALSQAPTIDMSSRQSSVVTRTTCNPPPPVPGPFKPQITHHSSLPPAPPLPSRVSAQPLSINASNSLPYKVLDRAPPPPPPGIPRASIVSFNSAFDSRFRFPNENEFPMM